MEQAIEHCTKGVSVWDFACANDKENPDIVLASAGGTPTLEALASIKILKKYLPELNIRYVNVVDLMKLISNEKHPHGLTDKEYNELFTTNKPIIFNFHGYPQLVHQLTYKRKNQNMHVRGYMEEGSITTPFDMRVLNEIDRFNLVLLAIKHLKIDAKTKEKITSDMNKKLAQHKEYIYEYGVDMPEIQNWKW
jgi:xylulose-5-phosphate/fructose-6-phosphate phosphoketolase